MKKRKLAGHEAKLWLWSQICHEESNLVSSNLYYTRTEQGFVWGYCFFLGGGGGGRGDMENMW